MALATRSRLAVFLFLVVSLPIAYLGWGERSAYTSTLAGFPNAGFGLFGYNYILNDYPIPAENEQYIKQILMFDGSRDDVVVSFTTVRAVYPFLASLFAPVVGVMASQVLVNWLAWAVAAFVAWRFAHRVFADELAGVIAVVLVSAGLGFAIHIHDYSPHLLAFTAYYVSVLLVYESRVWCERRSLRVHLFLGVLLAISCLAYTMGVALVFGYALVAIWYNRWWHVAVACAVAFTSRWVCLAGLNVLLWYANRRWQWMSDATESDYLMRSLRAWMDYLQHPWGFVDRVMNGLLQFSMFEFPLIVALGLVSWVFLPRRWDVWRFFLTFFGLPIAAGMAYLNYSTTRGYLVYGVSLLLYVPLAGMLAKGLRSSRPVLVISAGVATALVLGSQIAWSTAHLWGYVVPAKLFFGFGFTSWIPAYLWQFNLAPAFSITGAEPTPRMFGGAASLRDAGLLISNAAPQVMTSWVGVAALSRIVILAYACSLVALTAASRRTVTVGLTSVCLFLGVIPIALAKLRPPLRPPVVSTFYSTAVPPESSFHYTVAVSPEFLKQLKSHQAEAAVIQFVTSGIHSPFDVRVTNGRGVILAESKEGGMAQNAKPGFPEVVRALQDSGELDVRITTRSVADGSQAVGTTVFGWQRNGLPDRRMWNDRTDRPWESVMLPTLELRVLDAQGRATLIGF